MDGHADGRLRSELKQTDPELYTRLTQSWQIAQVDWLGALSPNNGSFNSYPHLRNVEKFLDHILIDSSSSVTSRLSKPLSPAEIYFLLSSVLFHDIGRTRPARKDHARESREILNSRFGSLGIASRTIANCMGSICEFHGLAADGAANQPEPLHTTVIDPFGEIRQGLLAALLTLADLMDCAHTRAIPEYLAGDEEIGIVGLFRRCISGVCVDFSTRQIRTALVPGSFSSQPAKEKRASPALFTIAVPETSDNAYEQAWSRFCRNSKRLLKTLRGIVTANPHRSLDKKLAAFQLSMVQDLRSPERVAGADAETADMLRSFLGTGKPNLKGPCSPQGDLVMALSSIPQSRLLHGLLLSGLVEVKRMENPPNKKDCPAMLSFTDRTPLAIVIRDLRWNCLTLDRIKPSLAAHGIPITNWVIDRDEHLYNRRGRETFESILDTEGLKHSAECMWDLCSRLFGARRCSYEDLASHAGEHDVERMKLAVKRISVVTRAHPNPKNNEQADAIWAGSREWQWQCNSWLDSKFTPLDAVLEKISRLESPDDAFQV